MAEAGSEADETRLKELETKSKTGKIELTEEQIAAALAEAEEADLKLAKKWAGAFLIGPLVPAVFAAFTIATGQIVMNTWKGKDGTEFKCGYALDCKCLVLYIVHDTDKL